jgi:hypothetical protein
VPPLGPCPGGKGVEETGLLLEKIDPTEPLVGILWDPDIYSDEEMYGTTGISASDEADAL